MPAPPTSGPAIGQDPTDSLPIFLRHCMKLKKKLAEDGGRHTYPLRPHKSDNDFAQQKMTILRPIPISSSCVFSSGKRFTNSFLTLVFRLINLEQGISFFP